jgi:hypothetical protein
MKLLSFLLFLTTVSPIVYADHKNNNDDRCDDNCQTQKHQQNYKQKQPVCKQDALAFWCSPTNTTTLIDNIVFQPFSAFYVYTYGVKQYATTTNVSGSGNFLPIYQTECSDHDMTFAFPLPDKKCYNVTMLQSEIYWNQPGIRLFNVTLNNIPWLTNFDLYAFAANNATQFSRIVNNQHWANVTFKAVKDTAKLAGIVVKPC